MENTFQLLNNWGQWLVSRDVLVTFQARKAVLCLRCLHSKSELDQSFNNCGNDTIMKLSVKEAYIDWFVSYEVCLTIQKVLILKFAFGPEKFLGLSRNEAQVWEGLSV